MKGGSMIRGYAADLFKSIRQLILQLFPAVPLNVQSAALSGAFWGEGAYD